MVTEPCACHPECRAACRVIDHPPENPCPWPDCLTESEMRTLLIDLRDAGAL